ncbi:MEDS domain-containing protein [Pyxidicoccus xibeiensis]|uniref:MEDS domain-containing protein n=1 Tax=Pyxidicoccus xibeiensis TaxID=2906759 RepID=UPI0020A81E0C|nr:MEDS domain-containing protein [Pyxidicoccus xibeiensis]MCP3140279.1 MEDS domain-containing protein [Pyxidicoccus xibeiensis]
MAGGVEVGFQPSRALRYTGDMVGETRWSGLSGVGELPWGSHLCHFYRAGDGLGDSLVPFLQAGLEQNEACVWVTSEAFPEEDARAALRTAVPDLEARLARGQLRLLRPDEAYPREGRLDVDAALRGWLAREEQALSLGYTGLRVSADASWLAREDWDDFREYERRVDGVLRSRRIIALCGYCLEHCTQEGMLEVVRHHGLALMRGTHEAWAHLEGSAPREARDALRNLTGELEHRVAERTEALTVQALPRRLARVQEHRRRLDGHIATLQDVSRLSTHRPVLDLEQVDLGALVRTCAERLEEELQHAGSDLCIRTRRGVIGCWDRLRIEQVFTHVLTNALRHAPGAPVDITVSVEDGTAVLAVRDRGPGISWEDQRRLFQRFSPLEEPAHPRGGFGLGLWVSRQLVELHGGSIRVESAPGQGSTFTVRLPLPAPPDA